MKCRTPIVRQLIVKPLAKLSPPVGAAGEPTPINCAAAYKTACLLRAYGSA
jgi:hypothetical protein